MARSHWVKRSAPHLVFVAAISVAMGAALHAAPVLGAPEWSPGPAREGEPRGAGHTDAACVACHVDIGAEWQSSQHRRANVDPYFQRSLAAEPSAFCRGCHAPEADPRADATGEAAASGVGCVVCHVDGDVIFGARAHAATGRGDHDVVAGLATDSACIGCHEFDFPGASDRMQRTATEHQGSSFASTRCVDCHMSKRDGHTDHGFAVASDPAIIQSAVEVGRVEIREAELRVEIRARQVGHAVPTGDLHRSLELRAWIEDERGTLQSAVARTTLSRAFAIRGTQHVEVADTRLPAPGSSAEASTYAVSLPRPVGARERVRWELVWQRMTPAIAETMGYDIRQQEVPIDGGVATR